MRSLTRSFLVSRVRKGTALAVPSRALEKMGFSPRGNKPALLRALQIAAVFVAATLLLGADPSGARFEDLGHKLMCRCGCSQILLECNHVGCAYSEKMRQELMAALQGPDSDDLILQRFVQEYGGVVLAAPPATGFNRVAWITPFAALGAGIFAVVWVVRRWRSGPPPPPPAAEPLGGAVEIDEFRERARKETEL
jgi:cytochrome c-type biogenesis protein CcmH/NrfF